MSKFERVLSDAELISATFKAEAEGTMAELRAVERAVLAKLTEQGPVAWRVHPFDYGIGAEGAYAITQQEDMKELWESREWKVTPLYAHPIPNHIVDNNKMVADMFWDASWPERCEDSIHNVLVAADADVGTTIEIQQAVSLSNITIKVIDYDEDEIEYRWELIENSKVESDSDHIPDIGQMIPEGFQLVPIEPTEEMHLAARDWSVKMYGKAIGFEASHGCYKAMLAAAPKYTGDSNE